MSGSVLFILHYHNGLYCFTGNEDRSCRMGAFLAEGQQHYLRWVQKRNKEAPDDQETRIVLAANNFGRHWGSVSQSVTALFAAASCIGMSAPHIAHIESRGVYKEDPRHGGDCAGVELRESNFMSAPKALVAHLDRVEAADQGLDLLRCIELLYYPKDHNKINRWKTPLTGSIMFIDAGYYEGNNDNRTLLEERFSALSRVGMPSFIFRPVETTCTVYDKKIDFTLAKAAAKSGTAYMVYPVNRPEVLRDYIKVAYFYILGIPKHVLSARRFMRTTEGHAFASEMAKPYKDLTL